MDQANYLQERSLETLCMIIPRILEIERRNRQKLADGTVKMNEIIRVAAARLMV